MDTLRQRLTLRGQDEPQIIQNRMHAAQEEIRHCFNADYLVVNDDFTQAQHALQAIIESQRHLRQRQLQKHQQMLDTLLNNEAWLPIVCPFDTKE